jgi:tRNA dimethylallyltransferase
VLQRLDPQAAALIHANDMPKLIRSIEVTLAGRQPQTEQWQAGRDALRGYRVLQMGLAATSSKPMRDRLYARINERAAAMFARGLIAETEMLRERYGDDCRTLGALGYAQAMTVLRGESPLDAAIAAAQQGHRNYAKRQGTWFRRVEAMCWLEGFGDEPSVQEQALKCARSLIKGGTLP